MGFITLADGSVVHTSVISAVEPFTKHQIDLLEKMIDAYWEVNVSGGSLHVVLEDGNWNFHSLLFCETYADEHDDPFGKLIAQQLQRMPSDLYEMIVEQCVTQPAFEEWRRRVAMYWDSRPKST